MDAGRLPDEAFLDDVDGPKGSPGVPRIFYATRTHSQIAQVCSASVPNPPPHGMHACTHVACALRLHGVQLEHVRRKQSRFSAVIALPRSSQRGVCR
jgi:hypothetical protein